MSFAEVQGYRLPVDRAYEAETHVWVLPLPGGRVRLGMDPLGVETAGTLASLSLSPPGATLVRGDSFGSLEAAKFVGPLTAPVSGALTACNEAVLADPGLVERDPFGEGWLVEIEPSDLEADLAQLVRGHDEIAGWFARKIREYRLRGVLAE